MKYLFFDSETTGMIKDYNAPVLKSNLDNFPRLVQLAWILTDENGNIEKDTGNYIIKPEGFVIPDEVVKIHGITTKKAMKEGTPLSDVLSCFREKINKSDFIIGHNVSFDIKVVTAEFIRKELPDELSDKTSICTMQNSINFCAIPGKYDKYKFPKLEELYQKLFNCSFDNAHDALADIKATAKCFFELKKKGIIRNDVLKKITIPKLKIHQPEELKKEKIDYLAQLKCKFQLSNNQKLAIEHGEGPLLVLAGAGSGKTSVLTYRVAYLLKEQKVPPYRMLALTFTNKAAKEMKERIGAAIGEMALNDLWIGTFHGICVRILHKEIKKLGISGNFTILGQDDQLKVIGECLKELNVQSAVFKPKFVLGKISKAKSSDMNFDEFFSTLMFAQKSQIIIEVAKRYQKKLKESNALDFDDILLYVLELLRKDKECLEYYQNKFKYVLVDEYQDTNQIQYEIVKLLSAKHKNLNVVGDVDQSIYSFRNADFRIILRFVEDFSNAILIKLEENYRSTKIILDAANSVIEYNKQRYPKILYTRKESGEKIMVYRAYDEQDEAMYTLNQIKNVLRDGYKYNEMAVLYRTNAQSRAFEEMFVKYQIPHQIIGGFRFYERKEVKDLLAYLKIINNPYDSIDLKRIVNVPKRGIGDTTISKLEEYAEKTNTNLWTVMENINEINDISKSTKTKILDFIKWLNTLKLKESIVTKLLESIFKESGYEYVLLQENTEESWNRAANIKELIGAAYEFEKNATDKSLNSFLTQVSLVADIDNMKENRQGVILMTLHNAKGLEFPVVFLTGLEEGVFPHAFSMNDKNQLEEERRLMYVGLTRAKHKLYLSYSGYRYSAGQGQKNMPSRFLREISPDLVIGNEILGRMY